MTITFQDFSPDSDVPFTFRAVLDGTAYNIVVSWNIYGKRWYINIYTTQGALIRTIPMISSPDGYDISMVDGLFSSTLVYRSNLQKFEVNDAPAIIIPGEYLKPSDAMLDANKNQFILGMSTLGLSDADQLFDALGNPFVLNQSALGGDVMLDASGQQFILGPSDQQNIGMLSSIFSIPPLVGAIIEALDANGIIHQMGTGDGSSLSFHTIQNDMVAFPAQIFKTDWQGKQLQYATARTNLLKYSQDFTNPTWTMVGTGSVAIGGTAPDGTNTACLLADTDPLLDKTQFNQNLTVANNSAQYEYSVYIKAGTATQSMVALYFIGGTIASHLVPLSWSTGVPTYPGGAIGATNIQITSVGNGWYRVSFTGANNNTGNTTSIFRVYPATGVTTGSIYAWGAQLETGSTLTSYIPTTSSPVTVTDYAEVIGGGVLAQSQDLTPQAMLDSSGSALTMDQSKI